MKKKSPSWSISGRFHSATQLATAPGPGAYTPVSPAKSFKYSIGSGRRRSIAETVTDSPGPAAYALSFPMRRGSIFGTSTRKSDPALTSPGPGTYEVLSKQLGPRFSLRPRIKAQRKAGGPGPGQYSPMTQTAYHSAPKWPLGKDRRRGVQNNGVPGPGAYKDSTSGRGPSWRFGSTGRARHVSRDVPGPGTYDHEKF